MPKFKTGDRVTRLSDPFDKDSRLLHGTVCARYKDTTRYGRYPELYAVIWDDKLGQIHTGFLPHGLDKE